MDWSRVGRSINLPGGTTVNMALAWNLTVSCASLKASAHTRPCSAQEPVQRTKVLIESADACSVKFPPAPASKKLAEVQRPSPPACLEELIFTTSFGSPTTVPPPLPSIQTSTA